ncbi:MULTISPECIES: carboxymuconolactone decarboxylase family protein [unclassified Nonomuraea]|uniref:carboxymuconolactone decarboxylase family protein n=1 Tax=unclassified Nonomuraea TaxID=2593643 RepID=UPI0033C96CEB
MRIDLHGAAPGVHSAMARFDAAASRELDPALAELVRVRASQLNGCAVCLGMHTRAALEAGEDEERLRTLALWRDSTLFTGPERAALALTESMTRIAEAGVPEEVFDAAREHFDETGLAHLLWTIAAINVWNRVAIAAGPPAG